MNIEYRIVAEAKLKARRAAFTLLELLLALSLLSVISVVTYMTFSTALRAWRKGTAMTESLHHGDFVMEQLVMALRSTYYPDAEKAGSMYGLWHEDHGSDEDSRDVISWVKLGNALIGADSPFVDSPHRVRFYLDKDEKDRDVVAVQAWQLLGQPEDFDYEEVEPIHLSRKIIGFNCRMAHRILDDEIEWLDEWTGGVSNKVPTVFEITMYLEPSEEGGEPAKMTRIMGVPVGPRVWQARR